MKVVPLAPLEWMDKPRLIEEYKLAEDNAEAAIAYMGMVLTQLTVLAGEEVPTEVS